MNKLNIVRKVRIDGRLVLQDEIPQEEFKKLLEKNMDKVMNKNGFDRRKTA